MTIAVCYLSDEGVVLGADSTSTAPQGRGIPDQYFDHQQKVLEVGSDSTLGLVMWGLGGLPQKSYRTLVAELSDELLSTPAASVEDTANRWAARFWGEYCGALGSSIARYHDLIRIDSRSEEEEEELKKLSSLAGGFCIGGRVAKRTLTR